MSQRSKYRQYPNPLNTPLVYPFGSVIPEFSYKNVRENDTAGYRYGFNTQEKDDEVAGGGNSYTADFWQYDSRLGRRFNEDPIFKSYESPYSCLGNNPIWFVDIYGADSTLYIRFNSGTDLSIEQKTTLMSQVEISLGKAKMEKFTKFIYLNENLPENQDDELHLDFTDHLIEFEAKNPQIITTSGDFAATTTWYNKSDNSYFSKTTIYMDMFQFNKAKNGYTYNYRLLGLVISHEITHGFLQKSLYYFDISYSNIRMDDKGHTKGSINLMSSGTHHLNSNGIKSILRNPNCGTQPEEQNRSNILWLINWATACKKRNLSEQFQRGNKTMIFHYLKKRFNE